MGKDSRGVMNVRLIEQLIELNAVVKPSRSKFKSWSWNIYIGIIVLFTYSLLLFLLFTILFYLSTVSFRWYAVFLFKLFAIYVINILEYMKGQQQPGNTALICCRDAQNDLGLRCPHMRKEPFSHDIN